MEMVDGVVDGKGVKEAKQRVGEEKRVPVTTFDVAAGQRVRVVVEGMPAAGERFRWPVTIPVLAPEGHPPIELMLHGR